MISAKNLYEDVRYLTEDIGIRLAGSREEHHAAEYLRNRFLEYVPKCTLEAFPVSHRDVKEEELSVLLDGQWCKIPATLFGGAPTTGGNMITAELVYFDSHTDYQKADLSFLQGKAVIHYGLSFGCEENYQRLMLAKPAFLLMVDTRHTAHGPLGDGLFPAYVKKYGAVPTMNLGFYHAWEICTKKAPIACLRVTGQSVPSFSHNVVAELPGELEDPLYFYFGGHTDTQAGSVGADDNAIGCAIMLELARVMSKERLRHTLRFIAFGAEEQLSVGSANYVRSHRQEIEDKGRFMCNFDSCGSAVGWNRFVISGDRYLQDIIAECYHNHDIYYQENLLADPFLDQFPFTVAGVPGITLLRRNCETGMFFHHQPSNNLSVIDFDIVAKLTEATAELILRLDNLDSNQVLTVNPDIINSVQIEWMKNYGGWDCM